MSDERILELIEKQDKYYVLGFIKGIKANRDELIEKNKELKSQLEVGEEQYNDLVEEKERLEEQLSSITLELEENKNPLKGIFAQVNDDMLLRNCGAMQSEIDDYKTQQQEFIKYLEDAISKYNEAKEYAIEYHESNLLIKKINVILQKYKEIIGVSHD